MTDQDARPRHAADASGDPAARSLLDWPLRDLLAALAAGVPTPGGGAAAAVAAALGAALLEMAAHFTIGKKRFAAVDAEARDLARAAHALRTTLEAQVDADASAFAQVSAAYALPRASDVERAARSTAIQEALEAAARVPAQVARGCAEVLRLAERAAPILNPNLLSDVLAGAALAHGALAAAAVNVEVNLRVMDDEATRARLAAELAAAQRDADAVLARVLEVGRGRLPGRA